MKTLCVIPARYASTRLPGKPLADICGQPMIRRVYDRACLATRSPLTGTFGDASVGGSLGTQLKKAGLDGIVITGQAKHPIGIVIEDGSVQLRDASSLSGLTRAGGLNRGV